MCIRILDNKHIVVKGKSHEVTDQFIIKIWFEGIAVKPITLQILVEFEHSVLGVE